MGWFFPCGRARPPIHTSGAYFKMGFSFIRARTNDDLLCFSFVLGNSSSHHEDVECRSDKI